MPVDKFGRMSDTKTKDTGVSLTYINNNYVRSDGGTPLTGSLDMKGNTIYNVADPVNPQDVVTKVYVDNTKGSGVIGRKIGDSVSIKENLDFLGKQKIKNLPDPVNDKDAATKEYVDTTTVSFLKLDQTKYNTKGDIDMGGSYTVLNVKTPIDDNHITDKKYVDEMDNLKSAFTLKSGGYEAKGAILMKKHKLGGLQEPTQDGEATTKKYVDDLVTNQFVDENDNISFGRDVDMEGNKIFSLPEPDQDSDPATKKYVDDLQNQYIDKRGNIKFGRNINLDNKRIFALKDPKKDYEATNKKYVDDSITKRLQEEKDKFLPQDPATKEYVDEAIKQVAGGDLLVSKEGVFIKANGHYRATAPLDIDNHKMENLREPLEDGDAVNKKYVDGIVEDLTLKQGLIRENGGFNLVDSYINMGFNNIRNVGNPKHGADAVPRSFLDGEIKTVIKQVQNQFKQLNQLVSISGSCYEHLKKDDYQFTIGGPILNGKLNKFDKFNGFLVPANGVIKHFTTLSTGLVHNFPPSIANEFFKEGFKNIIDLYGRKDNPTIIFNLVKMENYNAEEEIIGSIVYYTTNIVNLEGGIRKNPYYQSRPVFEFRPKQKYLNKEENFICSVNQGDIINIKTEYTENIKPKDESLVDDKGMIDTLPIHFFRESKLKYERFFLHTTTLTFLFKEMSFPNILELNPLDEEED